MDGLPTCINRLETRLLELPLTPENGKIIKFSYFADTPPKFRKPESLV